MNAREPVWRGDLGQGSIFRRLDPKKTGTDEERRLSQNFWLSYRADGREIVVSAKTDDLDDAKAELRRLTRNRENAREGKEPLITPKAERVTIGDLLDANLARARVKGLADVKGYEYLTETLRRLLGNVRAMEFRPWHIDRYRERRAAGEGSKPGHKVGPTTIHRELEVLETAFRYAVRRQVLASVPSIEKPSIGDNVRKVEIPLADCLAIIAAIESPDVADFVEWMLLTAMRPKGICGFRWDWFDAKAWTLQVPSEKRGNAREFSIEGSLRVVFERRIARRRLDSPFIFHDGAGLPFNDYRVRKAFYAALLACDLPTGRNGYCLYDVKKTAIGLLLDAQLSDAEAMDFSGHRTPSMLHRYRTKTAKRHGASVRKRDEYLAKVLADKKPQTSVVGFPETARRQ